MPQFSGLVQVDAADGFEEADEVAGGGVQMRRCVVRERERLKTRRQRGGVKRGPVALFIRLEG